MGNKRGHGEGTVFERPDRPGTWRAEFTYTDPATGEQKRKKFEAASRKEALAIGKKWVAQVQNGLLPDADKLTLGAWIDRWLSDYAKPRVRIKSYEKYEGCLRLYVKPTLGHIVITKLRSPDIQRVFNQLLTQGGKDNKGISPTTVRNTRRYLCMCLDQAAKAGLLLKNVAKDTNPPKPSRKEIRPLDQDQARNLIAAAKKVGEWQHIIILLAVSTGMRLGEIFGLKWLDIDTGRGIVRVNRALVSTHHKTVFSEPKTAKSRRQIPVPEDVTKELRKYKQWQDWERHKLGDKWEDNDLVITNGFGKPKDPNHFSYVVYKDLLMRADLDKKTKFHDLRHTHATLLLKQGVNPKVVQERLGHSTVTMTLDTYSHLLPDMQDTAVKALEGLCVKEK